MIFPQTLLATSMFALLAACGGSGSDGSGGGNSATLQPAPATPTAQEAAEFQARKVVSYQHSQTLTPLLFTAGGHTIREYTNNSRGGVFKTDARSLPQGFVQLAGESRSSVYTPYPTREAETLRSYQGFRGGVYAFYRDSDLVTDIVSYGDKTEVAQLPAAGKATYSGMAFDRHNQGTFTYHVDFAQKTGQGSIEGLAAYGTVTLQQSRMGTGSDALAGDNVGIDGKATAARGQQLDYALTFYGNQAEEIVGYVDTADNKNRIGLHGTRGAVTE